MVNRKYQEENLEAIEKSWRGGDRAHLTVLPTGSGKGSIIGQIPKRLGLKPGGRERVLFLVDRKDLVGQQAKRIESINPGLSVGVEMAGQITDINADIVCASIQTLGYGCKSDVKTGELIVSDRLGRFPRDHFRIIVPDEAHRTGASDYYEAVLRYFRAFKELPSEYDPDIMLSGFTATPNRTDGIGLSKYFRSIVYQRDLRYMNNNGLVIAGRLFPWLVEVRAWAIETSFDVSDVSTNNGDFSAESLASTIDVPERNELILREYRKLAYGMQAIGFCANIQHATNLANLFNSKGIPAYMVCGKTPTGDDRLAAEGTRNWIYSRYRKGEIRVLFSAQTLDYGIDLPEAQAALMCAPTKSSLRYIQRLGRVFRPSPSPEELYRLYGLMRRPDYIKEFCIVIDFCDTAGKHKIITAPVLYGLTSKFSAAGRNMNSVVDEIEKLEKDTQGRLNLRDIDSIEKIRTTAVKIDLLAPVVVAEEVRQYTSFGWIGSESSGYRLVAGDVMLSLQQNQLGQWEVFQHKNGVRLPKGVQGSLPQALTVADAMVPESERILLDINSKWRDKPASPKAIGLLAKKRKDMFKEFTSIVPDQPDKFREFLRIQQIAPESSPDMAKMIVFSREVKRQFKAGQVSDLINQKNAQMRSLPYFVQKKIGMVKGKRQS